MASKTMSPLVVDLSHHNEIEDWGKVYASGIRGVIHKCTQGAGMVDTVYAKRRKEAVAFGLLWGAYHFGDNSDVKAQVDNFLKNAAADKNTLLCLDFEPNGNHTMSLDQAKEFMRLVFERTGQRPLLYSGNLIKEGLGRKADDFFSQHRLWVCQYGPKAVLPPGWKNYWLWQYTGDGQGPGPHAVPGIKTEGIDLNVFGGDDLAAEWVHRPIDTPAIARGPSIKDKVILAATSSPVLAPSIDEMITAGELADQSRKVSLLTQVRNWLFGGSVATFSLAGLNDQVSQAHTLMQQFKDNAWLLVIGGCVLGFIGAHFLIRWSVQDYKEGRYQPRGTDA